MKNTIILKHTRSFILKCLFLFISATSFAQDNVTEINSALKKQFFYAGLPKEYYIAVLPISGCFTCEAALTNKVKAISRNYKIVVVYPFIRKLVQEKIKKENDLSSHNIFYIFDSGLYNRLYDDKAPKGYTKKVSKF